MTIFEKKRKKKRIYVCKSDMRHLKIVDGGERSKKPILNNNNNNTHSWQTSVNSFIFNFLNISGPEIKKKKREGVSIEKQFM